MSSMEHRNFVKSNCQRSELISISLSLYLADWLYDTFTLDASGPLKIHLKHQAEYSIPFLLKVHSCAVHAKSGPFSPSPDLLISCSWSENSWVWTAL